MYIIINKQCTFDDECYFSSSQSCNVIVGRHSVTMLQIVYAYDQAILLNNLIRFCSYSNVIQTSLTSLRDKYQCDKRVMICRIEELIKCTNNPCVLCHCYSADRTKDIKQRKLCNCNNKVAALFKM